MTTTANRRRPVKGAALGQTRNNPPRARRTARTTPSNQDSPEIIAARAKREADTAARSQRAEAEHANSADREARARKRRTYTPLPKRAFETIRTLPLARPRHAPRPYAKVILSVTRRTVGYKGKIEGDAIRHANLASRVGCSLHTVQRTLLYLTTGRGVRGAIIENTSGARYGKGGRIANEYALAPFLLETTEDNAPGGGTILFGMDGKPRHPKYKAKTPYFVGGFRKLPDAFLDNWLPFLTEYETRLAVGLFWRIDPQGKPDKAREVEDDKLSETSGLPMGDGRTKRRLKRERLDTDADGFPVFQEFELPGRAKAHSPLRKALRGLLRKGAIESLRVVRTLEGQDRIVKHAYSLRPLFYPPVGDVDAGEGLGEPEKRRVKPLVKRHSRKVGEALGGTKSKSVKPWVARPLPTQGQRSIRDRSLYGSVSPSGKSLPKSQSIATQKNADAGSAAPLGDPFDYSAPLRNMVNNVQRAHARTERRRARRHSDPAARHAAIRELLLDMERDEARTEVPARLPVEPRSRDLLDADEEARAWPPVADMLMDHSLRVIEGSNGWYKIAPCPWHGGDNGCYYNPTEQRGICHACRDQYPDLRGAKSFHLSHLVAQVQGYAEEPNAWRSAMDYIRHVMPSPVVDSRLPHPDRHTPDIALVRRYRDLS